MKHAYHKIPGWFNYAEMYDLAIENIPENGKFLEIGCFLGKSTHYLCTNLINAGREDVTVYGLDTFRGSTEHKFLDKITKDGSFYETTKQNLQYFIGRNQCHLIESRSDNQETIDRFEDKTFDVIMVDGAHEYDAVLEDIQNWWPKVKDGGIMLLDDMYMESVKQAAHIGLKDKVENFMIMQSREATGLAYKGKFKDMNPWMKIIPEQHFV
jgi:predicted O-methyltransferase YrrM